MQKNDSDKLFTTPGTADAVIAEMKPLVWTTLFQDLNQVLVIGIIFFLLVGVAIRLKPAQKWNLGTKSKTFIVI
ncbi:hypothetical protein MUO98_06795 [Candidatus Bathyarchaeota archaeon]|nr:hypothetical protein [Candidatus Bathyarchaeota archaeon]